MYTHTRNEMSNIALIHGYHYSQLKLVSFGFSAMPFQAFRVPLRLWLA